MILFPGSPKRFLPQYTHKGWTRMIEIRHLRKEFPSVTPLADVNAVINKGDIISVIGPSGTGKSTLLRCINMLTTPTSGEIFVDGENITDPKCNLDNIRKKVGMVFQSFNLFEHLMVIENVMVPQIDLLGRTEEEAKEKAENLLQLVGLADKAYALPSELSGGQKQRVAIARAIAMDPEILLLDEPTSALDPKMIGEVKSVIRDLAKLGVTMMIVTHEMQFARSICNRVFYMDEGEIYEDGTPDEIFENPKREKTRRFIYHLSSLELAIDGKSFDFRTAVSQIDDFGRNHDIDPKRIYRLQAVFEELCVISLLQPNDDPHAGIVIEYSQKNDELKMKISYPPEQLIHISDLSRQIIEANCKTMDSNTSGEITVTC